MIERLLLFWFATFAPPMPSSIWGEDKLRLHADNERAAYLAVVALWRFEYAEAMLAERRNRKETKP